MWSVINLMYFHAFSTQHYGCRSDMISDCNRDKLSDVIPMPKPCRRTVDVPFESSSYRGLNTWHAGHITYLASAMQNISKEQPKQVAGEKNSLAVAFCVSSLVRRGTFKPGDISTKTSCAFSCCGGGCSDGGKKVVVVLVVVAAT